MVFLELQGERGVYSPVTAGWPFKIRVCSATSVLLPSYKGHLRTLLEAWKGKRDASRGEAGDPGSLSSYHRDIGIPINFQEESGIVTF